ncbi:N-acetylglucosaminyldiphosphoundecaprenol N-acetyl-beta-D-mannosaminyltransferase [Methylomagnum ishizawai]|uniref:N-acetylglucosaminyldiphosphoundecaprenol N-acetyl-beta-D-mannosaminyltransferase n=1 Tax=Methylomagnum ishizawai TaxID=1760988 RepID=A0A1Y6D4Y5_9GAMM|nr:WecB/TagA/CpsF family glycosyltransferase [Methylomagnum ishizawai]SMF97651.1 N-acetylglucosaminyldiphosphoundecaprenol N-acetyl-beta-D-mannosaminyltransferase [Methylomagnum ishizawai]
MRLHFMGCAIDNLSMDETLDRIAEFVRDGRPHQHVVVNVDKLVKAARQPALRDIINRCHLVNVDGMPVVWAGRLLGLPIKERVAGVDLFERLLGHAARQGWGVYFLGARPEVVAWVAELAPRRFPGLKVAGWRDGYWRPGQEAEVVAAIRAAAPQVLFVAISSPKKEEFLGAHQAAMGVPFAMGVGGTFDVFVGAVRRAPLWMQRSGLEWFYRFLQEPRRMFRRYFVEDAYFFWLLLRELVYARR